MGLRKRVCLIVVRLWVIPKRNGPWCRTARSAAVGTKRYPVPGPKALVYLVDDLVRGDGCALRKPQAAIGLIGQGQIQIHHIRCDRIDPVLRNDVAGKRCACVGIRDDLRGRQIQQSGEVSGPFGSC